MRENIENLLLEHMKQMQTEMAAIRQDTAEIKSQLGSIETVIARLNSPQAL